MSLTLNSTIGDLILEVGKIIVESGSKSDTAILEIPEQDFYLKIAFKSKEEVEE